MSSPGQVDTADQHNAGGDATLGRDHIFSFRNDGLAVP